MYASHLNMEITDLRYAFKMMYEKKKQINKNRECCISQNI